jgi:hypothetical protein
VASIANTCKKEIFDILKTPRPDGSNAADDVIKAFTGGNPEEAQKIFLKLFTEKIPGDRDHLRLGRRPRPGESQPGTLGRDGSEMFGKFQSMSIKPRTSRRASIPGRTTCSRRAK